MGDFGVGDFGVDDLEWAIFHRHLKNTLSLAIESSNF